MLVTIKSQDQLDAWRNYEVSNLLHWEDRIDTTMAYVKASSDYYKAHHRRDTDMKIEARMPLHLFLLKLDGEPTILEDDKRFYSWLRKLPALRTYDYSKRTYY